jgi:hypothetical protein
MSKSPIGRSFNELVQDRVGREPAFAGVLLEEAVQCMLAGELPTARSLIRDAIKGSIGYAELSRRTGTPEKSLIDLPLRKLVAARPQRRRGITRCWCGCATRPFGLVEELRCNPHPTP